MIFPESITILGAKIIAKKVENKYIAYFLPDVFTNAGYGIIIWMSNPNVIEVNLRNTLRFSSLNEAVGHLEKFILNKFQDAISHYECFDIQQMIDILTIKNIIE